MKAIAANYLIVDGKKEKIKSNNKSIINNKIDNKVINENIKKFHKPLVVETKINQLDIDESNKKYNIHNNLDKSIPSIKYNRPKSATNNLCLRRMNNNINNNLNPWDNRTNINDIDLLLLELDENIINNKKLVNITNFKEPNKDIDVINSTEIPKRRVREDPRLLNRSIDVISNTIWNIDTKPINEKDIYRININYDKNSETFHQMYDSPYVDLNDNINKQKSLSDIH